jgi:class 3 adenylate cyclase/predicted ATPase
LASKASLEGERKQVTVLFADMKGSMELLAERDPEEARKILDPIIERMMEAVYRYDGTVSNLMGDGIMALFGAPLGYEDHAVRACYAALRMQESVKQYAEGVRRKEGIPIQIRVGLNSGEVMVGSIGNDLKMDYTAVGQTTHLAARMEQMATPGSIMMSADTLRLAEGYVQIKSLGPVNVKGMKELIDVFEITGASGVRTRLQAAAAHGLTRFVGRDTEVEQLRKVLEQAQAGRGQVAAVLGEPGVGKSRLFYEFIHSYRTQRWLILESGSVSYGKATGYLPVIDLLKAYFKIQDRDDHREIREKITGKLITLDEALKAALPAIFALLDISVDDQQWQSLDPAQRRQRTLDAIKRLLLRESQMQPLLLVFEDLHWIDSETQAVLDSLVESLPSARVLLLVNYRPEYQHPWGGKTYYTQRRIDPLQAESAEELLEALLGSSPALQALKQLLIERTEGNPFFLEESVRSLMETKALEGEAGAYSLVKPVESIQVPDRVQALLTARIDRLEPDEKRVLQTAAVIGKDVLFPLLHGILDETEERLRLELTHLQEAEFLYETNLFPDLEYTFKHALTHEVAYEGLLQERRRMLHGRLVAVMENVYSERLAEQVERLAHHSVRGEVWDKAVEYLHQAASKAAARCTYKEAESYFKQALQVLASLPETGDTIAKAIAIRLGLGSILIASKGSGAEEIEQIYAAARDLCQRVGETTQLFPVLWGLCRFYDVKGELRKAQELGDELLALAERSQDPALILEAHHTLWATFTLRGELALTMAHAAEGIRMYDPDKHGHLTFHYGGHDPGVCGLASKARILWLLGFPDKALEPAEESLALARKLSHPFNLLFATLVGASWVREHRREPQIAQELIQPVWILTNEQERPAWRARVMLLQALLLIENGRVAEALKLAFRAEALHTAGRTREQSHTDALLAQLYGKAGQAEKAIHLIDNALRRASESGGQWYDAELHRIQGELLLAQTVSDEPQAEFCFQRAYSVATSQGAKSLELRAAISLSRLWQKQGKKAEARQLLTQSYKWFSEGFDTGDLKEAKALLGEIS